MSRIQRITNGLREAALNRGMVSFPSLYSWAKLQENEPKHTAYAAMEEAAGILGDRSQVAYDSLMAKKENDLPGNGFFEAFKTNRAEEYEKLFGHCHPLDLSVEQKRHLVEIERERVYDHVRAQQDE